MTDTSIYFSNNGLHTHLLLPTAKVNDRVPSLQAYFPNSAWLQIGWGDYEYYGNPKQTKWMGLKALFSPTAAVMGILGVNAIPNDISRKRKLYEIHLDSMHWNAILDFVCEHLKLDASNQATEVRVKDNGEMFFEAHGTYTIFNTCNHWTARALNVAGLRMNPRRSFSPNYVEHWVKINDCKTVAR
ncbi:MAG: DUF2459 domain-containing protein [SAR92 clade bacterium]|uniref:DUF2459 domain-containing protein n=1 Tax=SAR92 clade bacterium TaxID=2315479 RepID=A0A520MF03_9GAMM|nr:MAG: DUF2459 domain-containing protein [SAR92 clade bacterium]